MTTDRELLELAAKAAGAEYEVDADDYGIWLHSAIGGQSGAWDPLTDDGDALRLAGSLKINILHMSHLCKNYWIEAGIGNSWLAQERVSESDVHTASRRAIVRAAAEIGRTMK